MEINGYNIEYNNGMKNIFIPFFISLLAGLSTVIGTLFIYIKPKNINHFIGFALALSASVMLSISILELIPEGFFYLSNQYNLIFAILSVILMIFIGNYINRLINKHITYKYAKNKNLYRVGIIAMIGLMIHNLPEGILTFISSTVDLKLGLKLSLAIMMHNIPEGIIIAVPIYYSTLSKRVAVVNTLISGLSEPLGAVLAYLFLYKYLNNTIISVVLLFVAGIMISISINDILDESKKYDHKYLILGAVGGLLITIITEYIL